MKKTIFLFCLFLVAGITVNAQSKSCSKTCTKAEMAACKDKKADQTKVASAYLEADELAASDENIQRRECAVSGKISYFQKSVCSESGKVSWDEVEYNQEKKEFTRVAAAIMEKDPETGEVKAKTSCSPSCKSNKKSGA